MLHDWLANSRNLQALPHGASISHTGSRQTRVELRQARQERWFAIEVSYHEEESGQKACDEEQEGIQIGQGKACQQKESDPVYYFMLCRASSGRTCEAEND
jgi:hypothetical protein